MQHVVNSGDSHVWEPSDLWVRHLPERLREGALTVTPEDSGVETIRIGQRTVRREVPAMLEATRPPGVYGPEPRLADMDREGVWAELLFPTLGLWLYLADDDDLVYASARIYNEWVRDTFMARSPRFVPTAMVPLHDTARAVEESRWAAENGFKAIGLPCQPPAGLAFNSGAQEPLWSFLEEAGLRACFHVGTGADPVVERGPGGAVINYLETYAPVQRALAALIASATLERHPDLHLVFVECGASWLAALVERMEEGYHQHQRFARPQLSLLPGEIVRRQVHVTFQRDRAALRSLDITGVQAVMFGTDYPHLEGTWPRTQTILDEVFAGVDPAVAAAVAGGTFAELFDVEMPAADKAALAK